MDWPTNLALPMAAGVFVVCSNYNIYFCLSYTTTWQVYSGDHIGQYALTPWRMSEPTILMLRTCPHTKKAGSHRRYGNSRDRMPRSTRLPPFRFLSLIIQLHWHFVTKKSTDFRIGRFLSGRMVAVIYGSSMPALGETPGLGGPRWR